MPRGFVPRGFVLKSYNIIENQKTGLGPFLIMSSIEMQPLVHRSLIIIKHESPLEKLRKLLVYYGLIADES
jgi:hypothetical protein